MSNILQAKFQKKMRESNKKELDKEDKKMNTPEKQLIQQNFINFLNFSTCQSFAPLQSTLQYTNKEMKETEEIDIKSILKFNNKFNIPDKSPLWYLFNHCSQLSFGPFSSLKLIDMYSQKLILSSSLIRLIDVFEIKNIEPFSFITLKELLSKESMLDDALPNSQYKNFLTNSKLNEEELGKNSKTKVISTQIANEGEQMNVEFLSKIQTNKNDHRGYNHNKASNKNNGLKKEKNNNYNNSSLYYDVHSTYNNKNEGAYYNDDNNYYNNYNYNKFNKNYK